jgi:hypothetical protein
MTGVLGPGRIVGTLLSKTGRRLESVIDRFAEQQLGLGPNAAALRLTSALHDTHANANPDCGSDDNAELNASLHPIERLIWVCNGYCSQCHTTYLPEVLTELPEPALKAIMQLMKYLQYVIYDVYIPGSRSAEHRSSQPPSNIGLASIYLRLLIQSRVLSVALVEQLDFLGVIQTTCETVWPSHTSHDTSPENLVALRSTIAAIQGMTERSSMNESDPLMRFESLPLQLDQFVRIRCVHDIFM